MQRFPVEKYSSVQRYIKIAATLPEKGVRDVALRIRWMNKNGQALKKRKVRPLEWQRCSSNSTPEAPFRRSPPSRVIAARGSRRGEEEQSEGRDPWHGEAYADLCGNCTCSGAHRAATGAPFSPTAYSDIQDARAAGRSHPCRAVLAAGVAASSAHDHHGTTVERWRSPRAAARTAHRQQRQTSSADRRPIRCDIGPLCSQTITHVASALIPVATFLPSDPRCLLSGKMLDSNLSLMQKIRQVPSLKTLSALDIF